MSKSLMRHHPRAGYTYEPETELHMPGPAGGYLVRANKAGFRSDREFVPQRDPDVFRVLLFGDSQTAADGVGNSQRYSDLIEKTVPGLEIYNYAVSGYGIDQELIICQEQTAIDRDLVVVSVYVETIRRITRRLGKFKDAQGNLFFRAKPYFEIEGGKLRLRNVPVSEEPYSEETLPEELRKHVYEHGEADQTVRTLAKALRRVVPFGPLQRAIKRSLMRFKRFNPVPDYDRPDNPAWQLLRKILESFVENNSTPVLVVLIPHYFFLSKGSDPSSYQARFREFGQSTGCHVYDLLPDLLACPSEEINNLWYDGMGHLSATGHEVLARLLAPWIHRFMRERDQSRSLASNHA